MNAEIEDMTSRCHARALRFHWPSQIPDGKGVSDKKLHSKDQTLSAAAHVDGAGHETTARVGLL